MGKYKSFFRSEYDYEEDAYDKLKNRPKASSQGDFFTNKAKMKKFEFDYEEDAYEPEYEDEA